jgi:hypothetical protein
VLTNDGELPSNFCQWQRELILAVENSLSFVVNSAGDLQQCRGKVYWGIRLFLVFKGIPADLEVE